MLFLQDELRRYGKSGIFLKIVNHMEFGYVP